METTNELVLNPSFVIPALYCSIVFNIFMIFIVVRILGPLRRVLNKIGDNSTIILNNNESDDLNEVEVSNSNKQNIDKKEDLF